MDPREFERWYGVLAPTYGGASGWGVVAHLCSLALTPRPERPSSRRGSRPPSPVARPRRPRPDEDDELDIPRAYSINLGAPREEPAMARPSSRPSRPSPVARRQSADEDDEPVLARQPANEIEAERQRVLALDLDIHPLLIRYLWACSVGWHFGLFNDLAVSGTESAMCSPF